MIMSVSTATGLWAQIDVHSHAITASYMDFIKAHGAEMDEGFPIPGWNVEEHLAFMDQAGIETAVLTITTADHLLYGSDYPYVAAPALVAAKGSLQQRLPAMGLDPQAVLSDNARRLFGADIPVREYGEKLVRLAEIEVVPEKLEAYLEYAAEVGRVSMATEPGVIALFSMQDKADPCKVYILEVYADQQAYQAHIQTAHFRKYKEGTADMVRSLKLIDTIPLVMAEFVKKAQ